MTGDGKPMICLFLISPFLFLVSVTFSLVKTFLSITIFVTDLNLPKLLISELKTTTIKTPFNCKIIEKNGIKFFQGDGINTLQFLILDPPTECVRGLRVLNFFQHV